jgi:hypothetical protein
MAFCSSCGADCGDGRFCGSCGTPAAGNSGSRTAAERPTLSTVARSESIGGNQTAASAAPPQPPPAPNPAWTGAVQPGAYRPRGTNGLAIASFVCSLLCVNVVAIVLGHVALSQIKRTNEEGRGLAIAGLVIGYITLALGILWFVVFAAAMSSYDPGY